MLRQRYNHPPLDGMRQQDDNHDHHIHSSCWHMPQAHEPPIGLALPYQACHQPDTVECTAVTNVAARGEGHLYGSNVHTKRGTAGIEHGQHLFSTWTDVSPVPITTDSMPMFMPGQPYLKSEMQTSILPLNGCNGLHNIKPKLCDLRPLQPLPMNTFKAAAPPANAPLAAVGPSIQQQQQAHESYMSMNTPESVRPYSSEGYLSGPQQRHGGDSRAGFHEMAWMTNGGHGLGGYESAVRVNGKKMGAGEESMRVPPRRNIFRRRFSLLTSMLLGPEEAPCESETDYSLPTSLPESIGRRMRAKVRPSESNMTASVSGGDFGGRLNQAFTSSRLWEGGKQSKEHRVRTEKGTFVVNDDYTQDAVKRVGRALRFASVLFVRFVTLLLQLFIIIVYADIRNVLSIRQYDILESFHRTYASQI